MHAILKVLIATNLTITEKLDETDFVGNIKDYTLNSWILPLQ